MENNKNDLSKNAPSLAIGGGTLLGLGIGFFLFHISVFFFLGSMFVGLGLGLMLSALIAKKK